MHAEEVEVLANGKSKSSGKIIGVIYDIGVTLAGTIGCIGKTSGKCQHQRRQVSSFLGLYSILGSINTSFYGFHLRALTYGIHAIEINLSKFLGHGIEETGFRQIYRSAISL